jgi:hypothetical protein
MARRTAPAPDQFALFTEADLLPKPTRPARPAQWAAFPDGPDRSGHEPDGWTGPCLYASPARGLAARLAEWELWQELYGAFGCACDSHAWRPAMRMCSATGELQLSRHEPFLLDCDLRRVGKDKDLPLPPCGHDRPAGAPGCGLLYRSACRMAGCDWEGPERGRGNAAVEDGMDHSWPGWRGLTTVPRVPGTGGSGTSSAAVRAITSWAAKVNAVYPAGWLESGGPIRTLRRPMETRHVESATPYGGYDLAVIAPGEEDE